MNPHERCWLLSEDALLEMLERCYEEELSPEEALAVLWEHATVEPRAQDGVRTSET